MYEDPSAFVELLQQKCALEAMYGTISAETFFVTVAGDTHVDVDRGVDLDLRCPEAYQHAWSISGISGTGAESAHSFAHVRAMEASQEIHEVQCCSIKTTKVIQLQRFGKMKNESGLEKGSDSEQTS